MFEEVNLAVNEVKMPNLTHLKNGKIYAKGHNYRDFSKEEDPWESLTEFLDLKRLETVVQNR